MWSAENTFLADPHRSSLVNGRDLAKILRSKILAEGAGFGHGSLRALDPASRRFAHRSGFQILPRVKQFTRSPLLVLSK